jgi:hypothetical protein
MTINRKTNVTFNIFNLTLKPFKGEENLASSVKILKECVDYINNERTQHRRAVVIDRNGGKKNSEKRELFITSIAYSHNEGFYKGRIALLRNNRTPLIYNKEKYSISPLSELGESSIAETTHFIIDTSGNYPIFLFEYHHHGPRISDIEYYIRQITSKVLRSSTSCKVQIHMNFPIKDVLDNISDVLNFKIKANHKKLAFLNREIGESFIGNMQALANTVNPVTMRIEAFFRTKDTKIESKFKNFAAVKFVKKLLEKANNNDSVLDEIEEFYLEFERGDGTEDTINLLKGKVELIVSTDLEAGGNIKMRSLFENSISSFKEYLKENQNQ